VLAEYVAQRPRHAYTVYTRMPAAGRDALVALPEHVRVVRPPVRPAHRYRELWDLPRRGRELAALVDAGGHDAALVFPNAVIGAHEVLPHLRTPALAYVPEPLRLAYEPEEDFARERSLRATLSRAGLHPYERRRRALDRRHVRSARHVVCHSQFSARQVRAIYGVGAEVVALGVRAEDFAAPAGGGPPRERCVLCVGALHPLKGHQFVVEALATLPAEARPPLVVVGDRGDLAGPLRTLAAARAVELEVREAIGFGALVELYRRAGVLACGQVREPFGLVALEGMAAGAPVVAVDEGGFRETIGDGVTGLLVPRDAAAFGAALRAVLDDPALAARLRTAALEDVRARWGWERTAAGFDRLLARLAAGEGQGAG
jgi:glycosyltransferase involved in cell wall biosynthesis